MKSVEVMKKGPYYDPENKETVYLDEKVYNLNDRFADLVVDEDGGDYTDEEVKQDNAGLDYSDYDLTNGARKLAEEKSVHYDILDALEGTGANGRITKEDLEDALLDTLDGSEG